MSSLDYLDLCRLCLVKDRASVPIFEGEGDVRQIFLKIAACLPVKVVRGDKLPKKICDDCVYKVEQFYQFWNTTANVEKQLLQWLGDVGMEDKQAYVSGVLNPDQSVEGRLNANVIQQTDEHQNNMGMNMMDTMNLDMPMMMQTEQSQMTTMNSNDTNVQTIQAVPGTSVRPPQQERRKDDEDESSEDEDNSDDECDADEGLSVKEETEETANRTIEPTFVNVSLPCDEAGPSGLQQQKINEMSDMVMAQSTDGDPKSGALNNPRDPLIQESYYCDVCGVKFPLENMLLRHKVSHNGSYRLRRIKLNRKLIVKNENKSLEKLGESNYISERGEETLFHIKNGDSEKKFEREKSPRHQEELAQLKSQNNSTVEVSTAIKKIINTGETYKCDICEFECGNRSTYYTHNLKHQEKNFPNKVFTCDKCDFKSNKETSLSSHKKKHKKNDFQEVHACKECNFRSNKKASLYSHVWKKHKLTTQQEFYSCSHCDYKNKNKYELGVHITRKHTDHYKFSCETCSKKFKVKGDLTNHIRFTHKEQPVICDVCGKTCLNSNSLYVHQKFAHYKAKFECQVCKRRMVSQENLNEHMLRQHEKRENAVCEECGKTFSRNSRLKIHMRIHTGDKPYTCNICNKSFARRTALKQHLLIHTGVRPYVCDICGKAFTQKPGLISHRKSHPGNHPPLPRVLIDHILNDVMNN